MQRLPKLHGFTSHKTPAEVVYTGQLNAVPGKTIGNTELAEAGLISSAYTKVKLLVKGDVTAAKAVSLQAASAGAIAAIEKAGGTVKVVAQIGREKTSEKLPRKTKKEA